MKAHVRVGDVEIHWTAKNTAEVRRMATHAGGIAAAVQQPEVEDKPAIGFTTELDPER